MKDVLSWIGTLPVLAQIPVIVALFLAAATILVLLIEIAPRPGRRYTIVRLIASLAIPGIVFLLLGSVWWAVAAAIVVGGLFFLLDYRSRQGGFTPGHRVVIAVRGRVAVSVTFTAEADRFDDEVGDVASHLESLQVR